MGVYILCTKVEFQNPLFDILKSKPFPCRCFTTIVCHFPASNHLCIICHFICLLPSILLSYVAASMQGMLRKWDFRVSAFGPNLKPRRRRSTTGILTQLHPIPAGGPWMVSLWYNCSVRSGQGSEFE